MSVQNLLGIELKSNKGGEDLFFFLNEKKGGCEVPVDQLSRGSNVWLSKIRSSIAVGSKQLNE